MLLYSSSPAASSATPSGPRLTIVPSATMAEHLRHEQARAGLPVRPRSIQTLAQLLDELVEAKPAPAPLMAFLAEQAVVTLRLPRFDRLTAFRGFAVAVAQMLEEAPAEGLRGDWLRVLELVDEGLEARGMARRNVRLRQAARAVAGLPDLPFASLSFEGFFVLGNAELELLAAAGGRAAVHLTLPEWPGTERARARLLAAGFSERRVADADRRPSTRLFAPASMEREAEEIVRRILEERSRGRLFRQMGIVLRSRDPYGSLLETTLARFAIPARFYFSDPLSSHPTVMFLSTVVRSLLQGWDQDTLLAALRMPASGLGGTAEGDALDFDWRQRLPARGLPEASTALLERIAGLDPLRRVKLAPEEWEYRLASALSPLAPRAAGEAEAFAEALRGAVPAFSPSQEIPLAVFWRQVETVLSLEPLRVEDRRRDVVHVMDVFEARQWQLPVLFLCGLTERQFPHYHREDPLLGDAERRRLGLDTAADRQRQERYLFDFATSRATEELHLSYPLFDEKGESTLPSFFLDPDQPVESCGPPVRPRPRSIHAPSNATPVRNPALLRKLAEKNAKLSPSSIESFLQCPFQFFSSKTLGLRERPPEPRDRLDLALQGSILHRALAEYTLRPLWGAQILDHVFDQECARKRVPSTYRTEAVRLELRRNFEAFLASPELALKGWNARVEEKFEFALTGQLSIRGRIDRLEQSATGNALVIDYKYSAENKIRERVEESGDGQQVQAGLYLAAAQRAFGLVPAGMLFCGVKKTIAWDGWHLSIPGLEPYGAACTKEHLEALIEASVEAAHSAHRSILAGTIAPAPADPRKCLWCECRDTCRIESTAAVGKAGGA